VAIPLRGLGRLSLQLEQIAQVADGNHRIRVVHHRERLALLLEAANDRLGGFAIFWLAA